MACILMVEDNPLNRMIVEDIFAFDDIPAELVCAATGEDGIVVAEQRQPMLILLDIRLPGMDGLETAKALKDNPRTQHIPIWGVTAQAMDVDRRVAEQVGFERYITKPFDGRELADALRAFCNRTIKQQAKGQSESERTGASA